MHSPALVCIKYRYSGVPPPDLSASQNQQEAFAVLNNNTTSISTETRRRSQDDSFFICSSFLLLLLLLLFLLLSLCDSGPFVPFLLLFYSGLSPSFITVELSFFISFSLLSSLFILTLIVLGLSSAFIFLEIWSFLAPIYQNIRLYPYTTPNVITLLSTGTFFLFFILLFFCAAHSSPIHGLSCRMIINTP